MARYWRTRLWNVIAKVMNFALLLAFVLGAIGLWTKFIIEWPGYWGLALGWLPAIVLSGFFALMVPAVLFGLYLPLLTTVEDKEKKDGT